MATISDISAQTYDVHLRYLRLDGTVRLGGDIGDGRYVYRLGGDIRDGRHVYCVGERCWRWSVWWEMWISEQSDSSSFDFWCFPNQWLPEGLGSIQCMIRENKWF